jgi:hypothetical protein
VKEEARTSIKPSVVKEVVLPKNPLMKVMVKTEKKEVVFALYSNRRTVS